MRPITSFDIDRIKTRKDLRCVCVGNPGRNTALTLTTDALVSAMKCYELASSRSNCVGIKNRKGDGDCLSGDLKSIYDEKTLKEMPVFMTDSICGGKLYGIGHVESIAQNYIWVLCDYHIDRPVIIREPGMAVYPDSYSYISVLAHDTAVTILNSLEEIGNQNLYDDLVPEVSVSRLFDYLNASTDQWQGQLVRTSGRIDSIDNSGNNDICCLVLKSGTVGGITTYVRCYINTPDDLREASSALSEGEHISIEGRMTGIWIYKKENDRWVVETSINARQILG